MQSLKMINLQRRLKKILDQTQPGSLGRTQQLEKLAQEIGCTIAGAKDTFGILNEAEVIRRIQEACRSIRENRLWWIALISAIASLLSAFAAWSAVLSRSAAG